METSGLSGFNLLNSARNLSCGDELMETSFETFENRDREPRNLSCGDKLIAIEGCDRTDWSLRARFQRPHSLDN
jgi:hypothetical protein